VQEITLRLVELRQQMTSMFVEILELDGCGVLSVGDHEQYSSRGGVEWYTEVEMQHREVLLN
jgi:hypothetical protein